jgi:hypothetical protein
VRRGATSGRGDIEHFPVAAPARRRAGPRPYRGAKACHRRTSQRSPGTVAVSAVASAAAALVRGRWPSSGLDGGWLAVDLELVYMQPVDLKLLDLQLPHDRTADRQPANRQRADGTAPTAPARPRPLQGEPLPAVVPRASAGRDGPSGACAMGVYVAAWPVFLRPTAERERGGRAAAGEVGRRRPLSGDPDGQVIPASRATDDTAAPGSTAAGAPGSSGRRPSGGQVASPCPLSDVRAGHPMSRPMSTPVQATVAHATASVRRDPLLGRPGSTWSPTIPGSGAVACCRRARRGRSWRILDRPGQVGIRVQARIAAPSAGAERRSASVPTS